MRKLGVGIPGGVSMVPGMGFPPNGMGIPGITPGMLKLNKRKSLRCPQKSPIEPQQSSKSSVFNLRSPNLSPDEVS